MSKRQASQYRQIWSSYHGPIPKDTDGRSYEIHHIDGNHENNDITNLIALSIHEHYEIHYWQEDRDACAAIAMRGILSPEEFSELARQRELEKIANGTHHYLDPEYRVRMSVQTTEKNLERVIAGTNPFAGQPGSELSRRVQKQRIENETHHFAGESGTKHSTSLNLRLLAEGRHSSQMPHVSAAIRQYQENLVKTGKHQFKEMIKNGTHPSHQSWTCEHCDTSGKGRSNYARWHGDKCKMFVQKP
jgi:hypothetical protein